jgi:excisionase family DNA binding protein
MAKLLPASISLNSRDVERHQRPKSRRRPRHRSIRTHINYSVQEAAEATGNAKGTILRWISSGALPAIVDRKPFLILGGDLADCVAARSRPRTKLRLQECYCFTCRAAREPALGMADYLPMTTATGNLRALCGTCTTVMHKAIAKRSLEALAGILVVTVQQGSEHLMDTADPSLNDHSP